MRKLSEDLKYKSAYSVMMKIALLLGTLLLFAVIFTAETPNIRFNSEEVALLNKGWQVTASGKDKKAELPYRQDSAVGETIYYSVALPESNVIYNCIMFKAAHEYIRVWLENELLYEFGYDQSVFFSDKPNNGWVIVRLPDGYKGKTLYIDKTGYYDKHAGTLNAVYLGTKNALVFYLMDLFLPVIFIDFCIIILSLVLMILSFFFKRELVFQVRYLSIFSILTSIWLILESGAYQLFAGKPVIVSNTLFICFSLIPIAFLRFLLTYECFRKSSYMKALFYISFGGFLSIHVLQFAGVLDYLKSIFIVHIIIILAVGGIIEKYVRLRLSGKRVINHYLFISVFVFAGFALIDILRFYITAPSRPSLFTQIGVLCFFIILSFFAIRNVILDIEDKRKEALLHEMAYADLLTGLPNRNAFEQKMEFYRTEQHFKPMMIVMDLNGLKLMNDTYGHRQGDNAIVCLSGLLKECFSKYADVYRIGGDEFCIIIEGMTQEEMLKRIDAFRVKCTEKNKELDIPISVAIGWSRGMAGEDIERVFGRADASMYDNKKKMKEMYT